MDMEMKHSGGDDRLSALPDTILSEILSLLSFKFVSVISTLSHHWRRLSAQLPSLTVYNPHFTSYKDVSRFWTTFNTFSSKLTSPLSRSLILHLHEAFFRVDCPSFSNLWFRQICGSSMHKIQVTSTFCGGDYYFVAPSNYVFRMQCLKLLELGGCFAWSLPSDTTSIHLPNLNKLSIHVVCYQFKLLEKLISSIPSLEDLSFWVNCDGAHSWHNDDPVVEHVTLFSPKLKRLYAKVYSKRAVVIIDAPVLQYLNVASYYSSRFYFVQKPALLQEAVTSVRYWSCTCCDGTLCDVVEAVSNVQSLEVKGLAGALTYPNLTTLAYRLHSWIAIRMLLPLLKYCPALQVLKLDFNSHYISSTENMWNPSHFEGANMLTQVKIIELNILYFAQPMNLIKLLLRNACVLEQLNINIIGEDCIWTDKMFLQFFKGLVEYQQKLLHCQIEYSGFGIKLSCNGSKLIEDLSSRTISLRPATKDTKFSSSDNVG